MGAKDCFLLTHRIVYEDKHIGTSNYLIKFVDGRA